MLYLTFAFSEFISAYMLGILDNAVKQILTCMAVDMDLHGGELKFGPAEFHKKMNTIKV